jgi:hypothetical protein
VGTPRFEIDFAMGRRLHHGEKSLAGQPPFQAAKLLRRNDHDFVAAVYGDVLWTFRAHTPNKFTETRLRVLQRPMVELPIAFAAPQFWLR